MPGFRGGSDLFPVRLVEHSHKKPIQFEIVTSKAGRTLSREEGLRQAENLRFHVLETPGAERMPLAAEYLLRLLGSIAFALRANPRKYVAVLSASDWGVFDAIPAFLMKLRNERLIWVSVCWHLIDPPSRRRARSAISSLVPFMSQRLMIHMIKGFGDIVLTETTVVETMLRQLGVSKSKIKIVQGALDVKKLSEIPEQKVQYEAAFVGRLHPEKGILDAVKIWKIVCRRFPQAKLVVVGSATPNWVKYVREKIANAGLSENIILLGYLPDREKYIVLKASKMFVHLSFEDGLPITVCEAMACGVPVAAYELQTYADGWMKASFIRVPVGNVERFAEAIIRLLEDKKLRSDLADCAKSIAVQYDYDAMADSVIDTVLERSHASG
jgi:glycosyltransferase involved in cell wall biosynthesis